VKRFLIFLLLGPVIGFAVYVVWQISLGRSIGGVQGLLLGLPFAFIFALLPSMVMWFEDWLLEDKIGLWPKVITSVVVGYGASMAMMAVWAAVPIPLPHLLSFGIVGAVQGGVCSWLSGVMHRADLRSANRTAQTN